MSNTTILVNFLTH